MTAKQWLIIGASGYVGEYLRRLLRPDETIATYHRNPFPGGERFDATSERLSGRLLRREPRLKAAFILQAVSNVDACARDPAGSRAVNVDAVRRMIEDLWAAGILPVFTSSDGVLDGTGHLARETDPVHPILAYGRQKAEIEAYLAGRREPSIIARLSKVVGLDGHRANMLSGWIGQIERGETIRCAVDQIFSPILAEDVARALFDLAISGQRGLFNLGGPRPLARIELLELLLSEMRRFRPLDPRIDRCRMHDVPLLEKRPLDQSMDVSKLEAALGRKLTDMAEVCRRMGTLWGTGQV